MPRSGSTFVYNVVRLVCSELHTDVAAGWIDDLSVLTNRSAAIVKSHEWDAWIAKSSSMSVYSYRDIRQSLMSAKLKFGVEPTMDLCDQWIDEYNRARWNADLVVSYEQISEHPERVVESIARFVNARVDATELLNQLALEESLSAAEINDVPYDPKTLLHGQHRTNASPNAWRSGLDPGIIEHLEIKHAAWFDETGYDL